jgi:hypothetical protein
MGDSYRIKTELGINKSINVQLDQEFEFLEILSLKIQQTDIYTRSCADYGVMVGRVTANNGFGVPNARVSIFIPIEEIDESNPIITSIYPYKSPNDRNDDGYRYNLLPYTPSYSKHSATGTLPSKSDVLTGSTTVEIYDKYYRFTSRTNDSGDYMIMGVPLGEQTIVMDVDLSDIGEFSLTPQDLIRMGLATEAQVAGNKFRSSTDLNSLPQIINLTKNVEISPLWGDPEICDISINRVDFDLRDDANVDIQPTSVFMGSMFSSTDKFRIRRNCKPKDNMGNLCGLTSGPGQILAIRQTTQQDEDGNPVLEVYELEQAGNVIDGDGTWLTELPMNLDYVVTNEFGERVLSNDSTLGIPTKSKYRFKIKWSQANDLTIQTRRPSYLVPNVKEYGWRNAGTDPTNNGTRTEKDIQESSYYFGLAWSGYTNGFTGSEQIDRLNEIIDCEDTFYEFQFNRVYTVSSLIDQYKKGLGRGRFIGIKEIDDDSCDSTINKFPVNDGFKNFDLLYFLFSILFTVIQFTGLVLLIVAHLLLGIYTIVIQALCFLCGIEIPVIKVRPFGFICNVLRIKCETKNFTIRLPMITYPDCQSCSCKESELDSQALLGGTSGVLSYVSYPPSYVEGLESIFGADDTPSEDVQVKSGIFAQAIAGNNDSVTDLDVFKTPKSSVVRFLSEESDKDRHFAFSESLTVGERINIFNTRPSYFDNLNKIKVTFAKDSNLGKFHFDNTITVLSNQTYESGQLLTSVNPATTTDRNFLYTAQTVNGVVNGITGTTIQQATSVNVNYAVTQTTDQTVLYALPTGSTVSRQVYPQDREYFQVVTAITVGDAVKLWNVDTLEAFPNVLAAPSRLILAKKRALSGYKRNDNDFLISPLDAFSDIENQYILILQRGVDPYSPKYTNEYRLGRLFGKNIDDTELTFTAQTRLNIPIQKLTQTNISVQPFNQNGMFYPSYFFTPGNNFSGFTTSTVGYYGSIDANSDIRRLQTENMGGVTAMVSKTNNDFYSASQNSAKYDLSEDVSGASYIFSNITAFSISPLAPLILAPASLLLVTAAFLPFSVIALLIGVGALFVTGLIAQIIASSNFNYKDVRYEYFTPNAYPSLSANPMSISSKVINVMRTDRLPSSDALNGSSWQTNPALLQQNNNFIFYGIPELDPSIGLPPYSLGAEIPTADLEGLPNGITVLSSFNCENMVGLDCYQGFGNTFEVNQECTTKDAVERGCYMFLRRPLADLGKDISNFNEWGYRFRFFYGLCRGVLAQSFMNNWINGSLYFFPIQVDTFYNKQNKISKVRFCEDVVYYNRDSNNFYYRSSPYSFATNKFVGKIVNKADGGINDLNLLYPTTVINLGMKDYFYSEITFDPTTRGFILPNINPTSYGDTSDLINLFVISRITDENFLEQLISFGDNSINQLFSRGNETSIKNFRIDGDLAQLMSINSEIGNINFSPEYYDIESGDTNPPTQILGTAKDPTIAVWFSSTTEDLQTKDYLTPGRINFRGTDDIGYYPYPYSITSQVVPFYQWRLDNTDLIFGNQYNDWATASSDIVQNVRYQSLDRYASDTPYFWSNNSESNDLNARGYIFNVNGTVGDGQYIATGALKQKFVVGAPFQFYFGTIVGQTALDKFKTKYSVDE